MNNKRLFNILVGITLACCGAGVILMVTMRSSVSGANTIDYSQSAATTVSLDGSILTNSLPQLYNLPPAISLSQKVKIQTFLYTANDAKAKDSGYYRNGSLSTTSDGVSILIDVPSLSKTFIAETLSDGNISVGCGTPSDQRDSTWVCTNSNEEGE